MVDSFDLKIEKQLAKMEEGEALVEELKEHPDVKGKIGMIFLDTRTKLFYVMGAEGNLLEAIKKLKKLVLESEGTLEPDDDFSRYVGIPIGGFSRVKIR